MIATQNFYSNYLGCCRYSNAAIHRAIVYSSSLLVKYTSFILLAPRIPSISLSLLSVGKAYAAAIRVTSSPDLHQVFLNRAQRKADSQEIRRADFRPCVLSAWFDCYYYMICYFCFLFIFKKLVFSSKHFFLYVLFFSYIFLVVSFIILLEHFLRRGVTQQ